MTQHTAQVAPAPVTLTSDHGERVDYIFYPWPCEHGLAIGRKLSPILESVFGRAAPVLNAVRGKLPQLKTFSSMAPEEQLDVLAELVGAVGGSGAELIAAIARALKDNDDAELFMDLLEGAHRKTQGVADGVLFREPMRENFNHVYKANYGELFAACAWALVKNFGPMLGIMGNGGGVEQPTSSTPQPEPAPKRRHK